MPCCGHIPSCCFLPVGNGLDLTALCVTSGKICWMLYVDALVLNMDGNILDALSIASRVGMHTSSTCNLLQVAFCTVSSPHKLM